MTRAKINRTIEIRPIVFSEAFMSCMGGLVWYLASGEHRVMAVAFLLRP
jgi:hypothetical protein